MADNSVFRGLAQLSGIPGSFDVIVYKVQQRGTITQNFELKVAQDQWGQDAAWRASNEYLDGDWEMKFIGDTLAHVKTGAAFLAPLAVITLSGFDLTWLNTTFCHMSGTTINLMNDDIGTTGIKMRRYVNSTQNTSFATTPS